MYEILAIAVGGAVGAVARFAVVRSAHSIWGADFPWGVLIANTLGSFLVGLLSVLLVFKLDLPAELRAGILVGVLGAFTTFSTFSLDTLLLIEQGVLIKAAGNVLINVSLCLLFVWAGVLLARQM